ncbi:MAG: Cation efflux system protein CusB precursor [Syntrophorhabdaceae bacterium PtaU1.Bin034]|nr:MAG: Cation efflux system protein CusB precursor [Syntrophorhabdaceae bacterium PtaU1.Bin034]
MKTKAVLGLFLVLIAIGVYFGLRHRTDAAPPAITRGETPSTTADTSPEVTGVPTDQPATVEIPAEKRHMMGIRTVEAAVKPIKKTLRTSGRVEYDERKVTTVSIKVEGWIERLYADYTGKRVRKGAPLADIYSPELLSVQLEYLNLITWKPNLGLRTTRTMEFSLGDRFNQVGRLTIYDLDPMVDVVKQKLALWEIPEEMVKELETSRKAIRTLTVKSPVDGYVYQKPVVKGSRVGPGDKIVDIVDLSSVWILADIYEYELPFVREGQPARITLSYYPHKEFRSKVDLIYPSLSGQTRTAKARFVIPNPQGILKPQMFANVEMELDLGSRLSVPENAILDTGTRQLAYVDVGEDNFVAREVKTGYRADGVVEIVSGIKAGEKVASSAVFLIDSEAKLRGVSK